MRRLSLILAAFALVLGACERHTWEDQDANQDGKIDQNERGTNRLYKEHHGEEGGSHAKGGEEHEEGGEKKEAH